MPSDATDTGNHLTNPSVDRVIELTGGKFMAVTLAARRARELSDYFAGHSFAGEVPPQVPVRSRHMLSVALDEIVAEKIVAGEAKTPEAAPTDSTAPETTDVG